MSMPNSTNHTGREAFSSRSAAWRGIGMTLTWGWGGHGLTPPNLFDYAAKACCEVEWRVMWADHSRALWTQCTQSKTQCGLSDLSRESIDWYASYPVLICVLSIGTGLGLKGVREFCSQSFASFLASDQCANQARSVRGSQWAHKRTLAVLNWVRHNARCAGA